MTIQDLFAEMMIFDNTLDLVASGSEVSRGITAVNMAQKWYEVEASLVKKVHETDSTFNTTANQEYTTWPTGLMRIDALWLLDANSRQVRKIDSIDQIGAHSPGAMWPLSSLILSGSAHTGAPFEYRGTQQGGKIWWSPTPDTTYTIRGYGLWAAARYTAAANTFLYPDSVGSALAPYAAKLMAIGLGRDYISTLEAEARAYFRKTLKMMGKQAEEEPQSRVYSDVHDT